jgi:phosphomannomutase
MPLIKSISGLRGIVDAGCGLEVTLNANVAADVGRAFATYLARTSKPTRDGARWLVGARDGRPGGPALLHAFARGAWECGARVIPLGVAATPTTGLALSVLADSHGVSGGVVITASHNPQHWNGIKLLTEGGRAPAPWDAACVFDALDKRDFDRVNDGDPPPVDPFPDADDIHVRKVLDLVNADRIRACGFNVSLDSINGAGSRPGRMLLESLGCRVTHLNDQPDTPFGRNPEPTEENLSDFAQTIVEHGADVGFAQDPDADRLALVDETGRYIGEEYTLALVAKHVFAARPGPAVANLSTSRMIDDLARLAGPPCEVHRSAVGEAHVVDMMKKVGATIGGEGNGGVIEPQVVAVRDSIVAMALTLQLMADEHMPLSSIVEDIPRYTIVKRKFDCSTEQVARVLEAVRALFGRERLNDVDGLRIDWDEGWVHVRGSNTEPIMRIIAEAEDERTANALAARVQEVADRVK